jgi:hypothetical protein
MNPEDNSVNQQLIRLLAQRWNEVPNMSLGEVIAHMAYNGAGHTEIGMVTDEEFFKGLQHGWNPL